MLTIRLLGGAAIEGPEGPVTGRVIQRARLALLALLVTSRNRSMSRDRLMSMVWPDVDTERGRHLVRDSVYRLRNALGDQVLTGVGDELRLDPAHLRCDVWEFEDAIARGDLERADQLYSGPFLDGFFLSDSPDFDQWVDGERRRLASVHSGVLERLATTYRGEARLTDAIRVLQRLVAMDPSNARLTIQLMHALDSVGDRAGALRQATAHEEVLRTEFEMSPDPDVMTLAERLRRDSGAPRLPDEGVVDRRSGSVRTPSAPGERSEVRRPLRRNVRAAATVGIATAAMAGSAWWYSARSSTLTLDQNVIAIMPFRIAAPDSTHDYLREGLMDLAGVLLAGDGAPRAVDTRAVMVAYDRARETSGPQLANADLLPVARGLGAGLLVVGELVVTPAEASVTARLLESTTGRIVAEHSERGEVDVRLSTRVFAGLLAKHFGEGASRLSGLSDSVEAIRAYLRGVQTYRGTEPWNSFGHFQRAMEIDPRFATAALWRSFLAGEAYIFGDPERRRIDSVAWSLRGRLSRRDSLILASLPTIGPNFPAPSTARDLIEATERAATANPDRVEVWDALASIYQMFGSQAGVDAPLERAVVAAERALSIDPGFLSVLSLRTYLSLLRGDSSEVRAHSRRFFSALGDSTRAIHWRWAAARALADSAALPRLLQRVAERPGFAWQNVELWSARHGLATIDEAERVATMRLASKASSPDDRHAALRSLFRIATIRGQAARAIALADSLVTSGRSPSSMARPGGAHAWEDLPRHVFITLGIVGPGYDRQARDAVRMIDTHVDTISDASLRANDLCYAELWRVSQRDTSRTRRSIATMRRLAQTFEPGPGWRVTRLDLCPLLLEGALEWKDGVPASAPAIDRVEALLRRGPAAEMPGNLARLMVARWRELQGRHTDALALLRGVDPMAWSVSAPAVWLVEGRVALAAGDSSGAADANARYLSLRDRPDAGPVAEEVDWVRARLRELVADRRSR